MNEPHSLLALARSRGARRSQHSAGEVIDLSDPHAIWIVVAGQVDVRAAPVRGGLQSGRALHLFEAGPGDLLPGTATLATTDGNAIALIGRCGSFTTLLRAGRATLQDLPPDLDLVIAIERWVEVVAAAAAPEVREISTDLVEPELSVLFPAGAVLRAPHDSVIWASLTEGSALAFGDPALCLQPESRPWPLTADSGITLRDPARLDGHLTPIRVAAGAIWEDLEAFGSLALRRIAAVMQGRQATRDTALARRAAWSGTRLGAGLLDLGQAADPALTAMPEAAAEEGNWAAVLRRVLAATGIDTAGAGSDGAANSGHDLEGAMLSAGVAFRQVRLTGRWWREDHGPLLGFSGDGDDRRATALLPTGPGRYTAHATGSDAGRRVDEALAATLSDTALMLYRPLPPALGGIGAMIRFGARGTAPELRAILLMGCLGGVAGLLPPIASGILLQSVLPRADLASYEAIIGGLGAMVLGNAAFTTVQAIAMARVQSRVDLVTEAGVWNRLLRLRPSFYRRQSTGDLVDRANGLSAIRRAVTGAVTQSVLSGVFSLFSGVLLFFYDLRLAFLALALTAALLAVEAVLFAVELPRRRRAARARGAADAVTFELLSAAAKLRTAGAESRAFARWSQLYAAAVRSRRDAGAVDIMRDLVGEVAPLAATALVFAGTLGIVAGAAGEGGAIPFGSFIAFQAAFGGFVAGLLDVVRAGEAVIAAAPSWERLRPILLAEQETGLGRPAIGPLRGALTVSNVTFSYEPNAPPALHGVSLSIQPGEYVALVGPSGSGKSTLLRLLLGLEQPQQGAVYVDGQDLATIDLAAVRRQFGVVLQGGSLMAASILENVLGSAPLPEAQAWQALRQAGLEADVRAMPMGVHTVLSEGGGGLSGGQRQRLLIARALVRGPRVLLFDEATSALDNATQSDVKASLDRLNITRVVVAHRLSTIRDVHRIVVLADGQVVEQGDYDSLIQRRGLFARLAARQLA